MTKLTPEQEQWVSYLETTDDPQTQNVLQSEDGFCCLGIGCKLFFPDDAVKIYDEDFDENYPFLKDVYENAITMWFENAKVAPPELVEKLGLRSEGGAFDFEALSAESQAFVRKHSPNYTASRDLANLNDFGATFKEIASFIRRNAALVFIQPGE